MREVVDGVFELPLGYVNMHLVITDDGVVLVDTGLPGRSARIERALHGLRRKIGEVRTVLLTHHHPDHTGNVAALRRAGAKVVVHAADAPLITGAIPLEPPKGMLGKLAARVLGSTEPTKVDQLVADGAEPVPGFTAVHTPGHTRGHVSYLLDRAGGVLFAGDAVGNMRGRLHSSPAMVSADPAEQARSVTRLAGLEFEHAVFGHGRAVSGRAVERFREFTGQA